MGTEHFSLCLEREELKSLNTSPHILRKLKEDGTSGPLKSKDSPGIVKSDVMSQAYSEHRGWCESIQNLP